MKKRNFSAEFKRESAQLVLDQNYTVAAAASAMDVGLSTMTRWVKQLRDERQGKIPKAFPNMDAPGDASTGSMRFATIYPASLVDSMTCAMMLSEPCFLITTPVFDYPGQLQAVTGMVAVISSVPANSVKNTFCNLLFLFNSSQRPSAY